MIEKCTIRKHVSRSEESGAACISSAASGGTRDLYNSTVIPTWYFLTMPLQTPSETLLIQPDHARQDGGNFPTKLHECLTKLEEHGLVHVVSFQPHGRSFLIHKQEAFVRSVLP
jgi:hypothetical protein